MADTLQDVTLAIYKKEGNLYWVNKLLYQLKNDSALDSLTQPIYDQIKPFLDSGTSLDEIETAFKQAEATYEAEMSKAWKKDNLKHLTPRQFLQRYGSKAFQEKYGMHPGSVGGSGLIQGSDPRERDDDRRR
jgi:hypothetical protein